MHEYQPPKESQHGATPSFLQPQEQKPAENLLQWFEQHVPDSTLTLYEREVLRRIGQWSPAQPYPRRARIRQQLERQARLPQSDLTPYYRMLEEATQKLARDLGIPSRLLEPSPPVKSSSIRARLQSRLKSLFRRRPRR